MAVKYYKVVNPFDTIHGQKKRQVGELIGEMDDQIGLRFEDGKEFYFWPDEVRKLTTIEHRSEVFVRKHSQVNQPRCEICKVLTTQAHHSGCPKS